MSFVGNPMQMSFQSAMLWREKNNQIGSHMQLYELLGLLACSFRPSTFIMVPECQAGTRAT